jgi:hypothetical protein
VGYYRAYLKNALGEIVQFLERECADDDEALKWFGEIAHPDGVELWQQGRMVADRKP